MIEGDIGDDPNDGQCLAAFMRHVSKLQPKEHFRGSHGGETSDGPGRAAFMRRVSELQPG